MNDEFSNNLFLMPFKYIHNKCDADLKLSLILIHNIYNVRIYWMREKNNFFPGLPLLCCINWESMSKIQHWLERATGRIVIEFIIEIPFKENTILVNTECSFCRPNSVFDLRHRRHYLWTRADFLFCLVCWVHIHSDYYYLYIRWPRICQFVNCNIKWHAPLCLLVIKASTSMIDIDKYRYSNALYLFTE